MRNVIVGLILVAGMTGVSFGGNCPNGRCNLNRRHVQPVISSTEILSPPEVTGVPEITSSPTSVRSQHHVRTNALRSHRRVVRTVR